MNKCIYSGEEFEEATKEHILQNFLGARWTDSSIVCNKVQKDFGHTIDPGFEEGLKSIRTLLGVKGGRGGTPPPIKRAKTEAGNEYHIGPGGKPEIASPIISVDALPEGGASVSIQVANENQLDWAIHQLRQRFPQLKLDEQKLRAAAQKSQSYMSEAVGLQLSLGGPDFFRGLCKAAFNLLGVTEKSVVLRPELDSIRAFILNGVGSSEDYIGWLLTDEQLDLPKLGDVDHCVGVFGRGGVIGGIVQLYGHLPFVLRFCANCECDDFAHLYIVNPFRDTEPPETREFLFDPDAIPQFKECAHLPDTKVWPHYVARLRRVLVAYQERADKSVISDIVHSVLGSKQGKVITAEDVNLLSQRAAEFIAHRISRPGGPNKTLHTNSAPDVETEACANSNKQL